MSKSAAFSQHGASSGGTGHRSGSFLGFPLEGFGFFTSLLLALSSGFFTFFLVTALSIFALLFWNQGLHHTVNYANSYLYCGLPAASLVWVVALGVFGTLWIRAKIHAKR
jgi:hypothetical protein